MHELDLRDVNVTETDVYKVLSGTVAPRAVSLVTTKNEDGSYNIAPFSFFNIVSKDPATLSISFLRKDGGVPKDTARNIIREKEAVVHILDEDNLVDANETSIVLPYGESELDRTNFKLVDSKLIDTKGLEQSKVRFETKLYEHFEIKNEAGETTADLVVLELKYIHLSDSIYDIERGYIDINELKPVARLAGNNYSKLGEQFSMERPE